MIKKVKWMSMILICIGIVLVLIDYNLKPSVSIEDIKVDATLQRNETNAYPHKEYIIDINMIKNKDCNVIIYPYIQGLGMMTYNLNEQEDYFIPSSIGSDGVTVNLATSELRKLNLIQDKDELSLIGFWFPEKEGSYKSRVYLEMLDDFNKINNPVLVCVYLEEKLGKQLTWAKVYPINLGNID